MLPEADTLDASLVHVMTQPALSVIGIYCRR